MNHPNTFMSPEAYHDAISERARRIWHDRGQPQGDDVEIWLQAERELLNDGLIPPAPPPRFDHLRTGRAAADDIDERQLEDRLDDFGTEGPRSATTIDPTTP
jgi:hypothetical protein